jgi:hypothetical protein
MKPLRNSTVLSALALPCLAASVILLAAVPSRATDYPSTILADHPSAYYRFEETSGTAANDSSTNDVPATIHPNGELTSPVMGAAGIDTNSFDFIVPGPGGESDFGYVDIPYSTLISPLAADGTNSGPFSAELWVNAAGYPQNWSVPIVQGLNNGVVADGWNVYVSGPGAGNPAGQSYFYLDMRPSIFLGYGDFLINFGQWYYVALTFDGTNGVFYINGVSHTFTAGPGAFVPDATQDALIASGSSIGWLPFNGHIDEVAFYTNVLTAAQVANHYAVGTNSFRIVPTGAGIVTDLTPQTNYSGLPVTFTITASGTLPLTYYWTSNSVPVGPNANSLTFTAQYPGNNGANIQVIVSNAFGPPATSSIVTLTVLTNLNIVSPPGSIARNVGSHAAFHVTADGAVPITYQWSLSTDGGSIYAAIPGATNETYWLSNVQMSQNTYSYSVTVSNPFTSGSAAASLTVQPRTDPPVPLTSYGAVVAADSPVAYWRLDETNGATLAEDAVGTFDGTYVPGTGTISNVPGAFLTDHDTGVSLTSGASIQIPFAPELNPDIAWSAETWIKPASLGANGGDYRIVLSSQYNMYPNPYNGWYIYQQPSDTFALVPQPGNGFIVAGPDDPANGNLIVAGKWYHLLVSDDLTNFNMYINGELRTSFPVSGVAFIPNGDGINLDGTAGIGGFNDTVLGWRSDFQFGTFQGVMDDTAFYNYALTPQQVFTHFAAANLMLTINRSGTNVVLTWPVGILQKATNVFGPFTDAAGATSPKTNAVGQVNTFWRVRLP